MFIEYNERNALGGLQILVKSYILSRGDGVLGEISINKVLVCENTK